MREMVFVSIFMVAALSLSHLCLRLFANGRGRLAGSARANSTNNPMTIRSSDQRALSGQIPDFCRLLNAGLQSGQTAPQVLSRLAHEVKGPIAPVLAHVSNRYSLGEPVHSSLGWAAKRIGARELLQVARILEIVSITGSDPSRAISQVESSARERAEAKAILRSKIADARASAAVVAILPPILFAASYVTQPAIVWGAISEPTGRMMIGLAAGLWLTGVLVVWRVANPPWL